MSSSQDSGTREPDLRAEEDGEVKSEAVSTFAVETGELLLMKSLSSLKDKVPPTELARSKYLTSALPVAPSSSVSSRKSISSP